MDANTQKEHFETYSRIKKLEQATDELAKNDKQLNETVQELVIQTKLMSNILERMTTNLEPRIKTLEDEVVELKLSQSSNQTVLQAVKWFGGTLAFGALTTAGMFLLKGVGFGGMG
jgi:predicted S18 family serine protease